MTPATDDNAESIHDDWELSWACKDLGHLLALEEASAGKIGYVPLSPRADDNKQDNDHHLGPSLVLLGIRPPRVVKILMVSGQTLPLVWQRPEHEWEAFLTALHYFASRKCGVPVWCVRLQGPYDLLDEASLPTHVSMQCAISSVFDIPDEWHEEKICCNCCEDCGDTLVLERWQRLLMKLPPWLFKSRPSRGPREVNCDVCAPCFLCDLCNVQLPGGGSSCLQCLDADACAQLTQAQQNRWKCVQL